MQKHAYDEGQLQAMYQMGLIPRESLEELGLISPPNTEDYTTGQPGLTPYVPGYSDFPYPSQQPNGLEHTIRKIGPAAGALIGAAGGALLHNRLGMNMGPAVLSGLGTGATLGWMPDVFATAKEELDKD